MALFFWDANGDEPVYASGLNNGHLGSAVDLADLTGYNTTSLPNKVKAYVPGYGIYLFDSGSTLSGNGSTVIQPTTGPGRWILDVISGTSGTEGDSSDVEMELQDLQESILQIPETPKMWTIKVYQASLSVAATSFGSYTFTLAEQGVTFNKPDAVHIQSPQEQATLIQSASYFKTQNIVVARFYNPTAGAVTIDGGEWVINIWRNPNA